MARITICILFSFILLLDACAPSRYVKPLEKGKQALSFSFGGPGILFSGAPVPIPFSSFCYARGLNNNITGFASLHFTSSLFGNIQSDLGASIRLFERSSGLGLSFAPALQTAYSVGNQTGFKIWPTVDVNLYCPLFKGPSYLYGGLNTWVELSKYKAHGELQQRHLIPNLQVGYVLVKTRWEHQFELKYLGLGIPNTPGVVDYIGMNGKGSFGFYYQLIRKF